MQFLYPQFLFALFGLAIPVIIHLFNFRRYKKIFFSNVKFISAVQQEHHAKNKLKNLLLLLVRLLALASIIIAFAHPYIPQQNKLVNPGKKYVSIYVDNSFSMGNTAEQGELLQTAKKHAEEIAKSFGEGDGFNLITNDFELRHQRWVSKSSFLTLLTEVKESPAVRTMPEVYKRMHENFRSAESGNKAMYYISDFQENMVLFDDINADTSVQTFIIPLKASQQNNVYIDSAWFDNPIWQMNQVNTIQARIKNTGNNAVDDGTLTLNINGAQKALANFSLAANSSTTVKLTFTVTNAGFNKGELSLDDFPVTFDNRFYFSFNVSKVLPVLIINGQKESADLNKAFAAEPAFSVTNIGQGNIDFSSLQQYRFIILNEPASIPSGLAVALKDFLTKNGNVLLIPAAAQADLASYRAFTESVRAAGFYEPKQENVAVSPLDAKNPFFQGIFEDVPRNISMPKVSRYYPQSRSAGSINNNLLQLQNGDVFFSAAKAGRGNFYSLAIPLNDEWSNFTAHALFLPLLYKMALQNNSQEKICYTLGEDNYLQLPDVKTEKENIYRLVKDTFDIIPPQKMLNGGVSLFVENLIPVAGHYSLAAGKTSAQPLAVYAFNYNRTESVMKFTDVDDLKEKAAALNPVFFDSGNKSVSYQISDMQSGTRLWKWFVVLALVFLLTETLITRFWK